MKKDSNNSTLAKEQDEKILENIVNRSTKYELKKTIEHMRNADSLQEQYKILLTTDKGYITESLTQDQIMETLDVSSRTKRMDLNTKYGPYCTDFTRDGRFMLVGGERGHLAMFDWKAKTLSFDMNVKERIRAVKYLHKETMVAVSQKDYTFVYDNEGKEMHCIRQIHQASHFEFLPYHFLLVAGTEKGFINYLDTSIGEMVATIKTFHGPVTVMCQNPWNAIICTAHSKGTVTMWSPNEKSPVMKMLCHDTALRNITIDNCGNYLVTAGQDRKLKVWDLRMSHREMADLRLGGSVSHLQFSQTGLLAVAVSNDVHILKDVHMACQSSLSMETTSSKTQPITVQQRPPLLSHSVGAVVSHLSFCPFEDILAVGHASGISTMFVPGSGEPNMDAFEANPYGDKRFRNEQEVKRLLEKIPAELIHLDSTQIGSVHLPSVSEQFEEDKKKLFGERPVLAVKSKRSKKSKPKPATVKKISTKDNLYYERLKLQTKLYEPDMDNYKRKRPFSRAPTDSALDNLIYKQ